MQEAGAIGCEVKSHAAYLRSWIELLKESPKALFQVLSETWQAMDLTHMMVPRSTTV